jgi:hypothetical protein
LKYWEEKGPSFCSPTIIIIIIIIIIILFLSFTRAHFVTGPWLVELVRKYSKLSLIRINGEEKSSGLTDNPNK